MTISTWIVVVGAIFGYVVLPTIVLIFCSPKAQQVIMCVLVFFFVIILVMGVTFDVEFDLKQVDINFEFNGIALGKKVNWKLISGGVGDIGVNLVMLFPLGAVINLISNKNIWIRLLISIGVGLLIGAFIETMQFVLPVSRSVQLSDVVLNMISLVIGTLYYALIKYLKQKSSD